MTPQVGSPAVKETLPRFAWGVNLNAPLTQSCLVLVGLQPWHSAVKAIPAANDPHKTQLQPVVVFHKGRCGERNLRLRPRPLPGCLWQECRNLPCHGFGKTAVLRYTCAMSIRFSVMVLAGGHSSRMGRDKAFLSLGGRPLVEHVLDRVAPLSDDILLVVRHVERFQHLPFRLVEDRPGPRGALTGLVSGLREARHEWALAVACDMPFLNVDLIRHMVLLAPGHDVVVPQIGGYLEPLHTLYRRTCLGPMEDLLRQGEQKVIAFFPQMRVRVVDERDLEALDPRRLSFWNVNTPDDWERTQQLYAELAGERGPSPEGAIRT